MQICTYVRTYYKQYNFLASAYTFQLHLSICCPSHSLTHSPLSTIKYSQPAFRIIGDIVSAASSEVQWTTKESFKLIPMYNNYATLILLPLYIKIFCTDFCSPYYSQQSRAFLLLTIFRLLLRIIINNLIYGR